MSKTTTVSCTHGYPDRIEINLLSQQLMLYQANNIIFKCLVSTAKNGAGEKMNSGMTPRGHFAVRVRFGAGLPLHSVFVARRFSGEIYTPALAARYPDRDWILTRILWLGGLEPGYNRYGEVDTLHRYIYLHGCPPETMMGIPGSHGCIRLQGTDMITLFDLVPVGIHVYIS